MALYVVATPIGNMEDITLRALRVLKEVDLVAAEDTRKTSLLLAHFDIKAALTSYYEHNKLAKLDHILSIAAEKDVALVSEAGMPGISDPGFELIREAVARGVLVIALPGPSAVITALAVSGLPTDQFTYVGFLSRRSSARRSQLQSVAGEPRTLIVYEAPHRVEATLDDILQILGNRRVAVCRELTKLHEEVFRGTVQEALAYFRQPRGEFTIVIEGAPKVSASASLEEAMAMIETFRQQGSSTRDAVSKAAQVSGHKRKELYKLWLKQP